MVLAHLAIIAPDRKTVVCGQCRKRSTILNEKFIEKEKHKMLTRKSWVIYSFDCKYCHFENQVNVIE